MSKSKITISLDEDLLNRIDRLIADNSHPSRSRFISKAIVEKLERTAPLLADIEDVEPVSPRPEKEVPHPTDEWSEL